MCVAASYRTCLIRYSLILMQLVQHCACSEYALAAWLCNTTVVVVFCGVAIVFVFTSIHFYESTGVVFFQVLNDAMDSKEEEVDKIGERFEALISSKLPAQARKVLQVIDVSCLLIVVCCVISPSSVVFVPPPPPPLVGASFVSTPALKWLNSSHASIIKEFGLWMLLLICVMFACLLAQGVRKAIEDKWQELENVYNSMESNIDIVARYQEVGMLIDRPVFATLHFV